MALPQAEQAWITGAAAFLVYEKLAPDDQMLTDAFGRFANAHPIAAALIVTATVAHLYQRLPRHLDPFKLLSLLR